eukprot:Seg265.3 transcript_id=Seg265.3/GoldUCD/mRNA.D3Y31 product="Transposon TX1 putative 149 kDa protein" protein_id=Seg265.3/GoldUCD/D3Y31
MAIGVLSINVHGIRDSVKKQNLIFWLSQQPYEVIFLQETFLYKEDDVQEFKRLWNGKAYFSFGSFHSRGVGILFKNSFKGTVTNAYHDNDGRWVNVIISLNGSKMQLMNIYAPCPVGERAEFFQTLPVSIWGGIPTVVGGDFNTVEDLYLDKCGGDSQPGATAVQALKDLAKMFGLVDIFRSLHPSARIFTWTNFKVSSRLDKFYVSKEISEAALLKADIIIYPFSDHDAPVLSFEPPFSPSRGKGVWKFNTRLLEVPEFTEKMKQFLEHWKSRKIDFTRKLDAWWDIGKRKIRRMCQEFSLKEAKKRKKERRDIETKIKAFSISADEDDRNQIVLLRKKLETLDLIEINGARIRAKELHFSCNEKSSHYFYSLENRRQSKKVITVLRKDDGDKVQGNQAVLDHIATFYESLYTAENTDPVKQSILLETIDKSVPDSRKNDLEEPLSPDECKAALDLMKQDKSPGSDGLPAEFYKFFWDTIGEDLVEVLNFCFSKGLLTESMRLAILSLIYKKNDIELIKNWRPISLLNVDYKIGSKAFATRLKTVLPHIISSDQTCSVPGRSIFDNLMLIRDTFDYCEMKKLPLAIVKIDQEKAFDRVNWQFLEKVLSKMNFGPNFIRCIQTMYTAVSCKISNNGHLSRSITLERGVRQGCPLSPLLYCIVAETLGNLIRNNIMIDGLRIPGCTREIKISQYADDTTLFLKNDYSVDQALLSIHDYERGSGSKVNYDRGKSCGKWLYKPDSSSIWANANLNWTVGPLEILGVLFGSKEAIEDTWMKRVEKLINRLDAWSHRSLSLKGKILIVNTIALSGLVYAGTIFGLPENIRKQIDRAIFQFIWSNKNELVSRKACLQPIERGGLGVVDIRTKIKALHLKYVGCLCDQSYVAPWVYFARYFIGVQLVKYAPGSSFLRSNNNPHALTPSEFYRRLLSHVNEYKDYFLKITHPDRTTKAIYSTLLGHQFDKPLCEYTWQLCLGKQHDWKIPWLNSRLGVSIGFENDVIWKIYHRVLKTASYVKSWGLRVSDSCDICAVPEDIEHVFLHCHVSLKVWEFINTYIVNLLGTFEVSCQFLFFFEFPRSKNRNAKKLSTYLLKLCIYQIWLHRCERRFERIPARSESVISAIRAEIKERIKLVFHAKGELQKQFPLWEYGEVLCKNVNGKLLLKV